ncbi:sugar translocase [Psychromonas marina]|uniref:Sugar translocase n=1 Tax=Psychromonas marina TaxID=88364 RepID=A0ABQ6E214_9GAMM|nr:oligosaccharide flippase family protein [Psychromonas marina]GLS91284.1 sugar translocase [Psychromonas marina]
MNTNKLVNRFKLTSDMILSPNIKQGILYGASIALMKGVSLLILPFVANHLSTEEFGRLEVISTIAVIGSILVGMGLEDTLFRFAGSEKSALKRRNTAAEIFTLTLIIAFFTLLGGWYLAPLLTPYFPGGPSVYEVRILLSVLALEGAIAVPLGWLRMNDRALSFFFSTTGRALIQSLLVVIFVMSDRGVTGILEAGLIAGLLQALLLIVLQLRDCGLKFNQQTSKRAFIYSLPIVASGLVAFGLNGMDRWVLAEQATLTDVAQFGIAAKFALAMVLLMQPFGMWWSPRRFEVLNSDDGKQKVAKYIVLGTVIALLITVVVALISPALIYWLLPATYHQAAQYVVAIALIMLLKELVELYNIGCFNGETTSSQLIINVVSTIIGISLMLWLTPLYQVWAVIFSLLMAQLIRLVLFYQVSQHFLSLAYPIHSLLLLSLLSALWLLVGAQVTGLALSLLVLVCAVVSLLLVAQQLKLISLPNTLLNKVAST